MILLCGIPTETPLRLVAAELDSLGAPYAWFNQRRVGAYAMAWEVVDGEVNGWLDLEGSTLRLADVSAVYTRLMDDGRLPELAGEPEGSPLRKRSRAIHEALFRWCEVAPALVVNRATPQGSNSSKPYQAQLLAPYGFHVPETLVTNEPDLVRSFKEKHGRVIYKSMSGVRSIVQELTDDDLLRLDRIRWCPVQFQAFVPGTNVRVHTVDGRAFATEVTSTVTDYRYAAQFNGETHLSAAELPDHIAEACLAVAAGLGLVFAGIDLKVTTEGDVYCFEVNPSPAYSYFELNTGQPIARTLAQSLVAA